MSTYCNQLWPPECRHWGMRFIYARQQSAYQTLGRQRRAVRIELLEPRRFFSAPPVPVGSSPSAQTTVENVPLTFSSADGNSLSTSGLDTAFGLSVSSGILALSTTSGLTFLNGTSNGRGDIQCEGSLSAMNAALNGLVFTPAVNFTGSDPLTFSTDVTLLGLLTLSGTNTVPITVTPAAPTVAAPAAANPNPVTGTTAALSVLGAEDNGEATLTYTWATTGTPPAAVVFSANGTNAAQNTTATFTKSGSYNFQVTITNTFGLSVTSSVGVTVDQTITTIVVSPGSAALNENQTEQFTAAAYDQFGQSMASVPVLTWSRASGVGGVSASGLYTAPDAAGVASITATSGLVSGSATISVTDAPPTVATTASATPAVVTGTTTTLSVLGADDGGESSLTYTWSTTGTPPAPVSFSANGTNAAKNSTVTFFEAGTYDFGVTVTDASGLSVTSSTSVIVEQTLTTISVTPTPVTVAYGGTQQFTAVGDDQFGVAMASQPLFTWNQSSGVGSIDSSGLYTAPGSGGTASITASSGLVSGTGVITVSNTPPTVATAAAATPSPVTGTTTLLTVLGADGGGEPNLTYTWAAIVKPGGSEPTFSANGTNAAKASTVTFDEAGNYVFQVTIQNLGGATVTSSVSVTVNQTLTSITISPGSAALNLNATEAFSATAYDQFAAAMLSQPVINWSVASGVGSINSSTGVYNSGPSAGSAVVNATSGSVTGTADVSVTNAAPTIVAFAAAFPSPVTGTSTALSVLGADDGGEANLTYYWITTGTPPAAVIFSANGNNSAKNTIATFSEAGNYTFEVTATDTGGLSATSSVSVTVSQTLTSIVVSPGSAALNENQTEQFTAVGYDQFGQLMSSQSGFVWARASGVGSITASGLYTAPYGTGVSDITATSGLVSGSASISITNAAPTIATAASADPSQVIGTTTTLSVLGADDGGEPNLTYTWSTTGTPPAAVSFSDNASNSAKDTVASFIKAGDYEFLVTVTDAGGLSVTSSVNVTVNQTLTSLTISPAPATVMEGQSQAFGAVAADQFGNAMATPTLTWEVMSGTGSIDGSGIFTAASTSGTSTISASSGDIVGEATITVPNEPPTVAIAAAASPNPVATTFTALSVLGADDDGESNLTYTWSAAGTPAGLVSFSVNGTNSAKMVTATFSAVGTYDLVVTITDAYGATVSSSVNVIVVPVLSGLRVTPANPAVGRGQTVQLSATAYDQFGAPLAIQPAVAWSTNGTLGSIDSSGLYTAPTAGDGSDPVVASCENVSGSASVHLVDDLSAKAPASISTEPNVPVVFAGGNAISITDADVDTASVPVSVTVGATDGTIKLGGTSGLTFSNDAVGSGEELTFSGSITDVDQALRGMVYTPDANFTGTGSTTVTINETGSGNPSPSYSTAIKVFSTAVPTPSGGGGQTAPGGSGNGGGGSIADTITGGSSNSNTTTDSTSTTSGGTGQPVAPITGGGDGGGSSVPAAPAAQPTPAAPLAPAPPPAAAKPSDRAPDPAPAKTQTNTSANNASASPVVPNPQTVADVRVATVPEQVFTFLSPNGEMASQLDAESKKLVSDKQITIVAGTATVASFSVSAAYLLWLVRGGSLLSSLLSILPAWKSLDPLPVLDNFESRKRRKKRLKSDVESLESMVDKSNTVSAGADDSGDAATGNSSQVYS